MEPKTKILQSIRIPESTQAQVEAAIEKLNNKGMVEISLADYVRLALTYFARDVMSDRVLDIQMKR